MGDSGRRRGSMRHVIDEDLPPTTDRRRYREYSPSPHDNTLRPRDHSRWSSLEEKGDSIVKDNMVAETRERLHDSRYYRSMSPGFDELEQQKWSNGPDKKWSQSHSYGERRRSRSRSRGLEKSRSRSPFWSRGTKRTRDWSRSRSRSRSRSKGSVRGHSRSRSPRYDQGPESHRWSDRKSVHGRPSQTCKDFETGMCRRGSQCRFIHSDNVVRDDEPLDSDIDGRWNRKQELGHGSKYHYDKAAGKYSDAYHGENGPSSTRPRSSVTCRDFIKGNCRYGESCRFSHSAENDSVGRSFRNVPVDSDHGHNSTEARRSVLCKFFLAGNCRRDNCRFSHDTSLSNEHEDRIHDEVGGRIVRTLDDWKGPRHEDRIHDKTGGRMVGSLDGPPWDVHEKPANTRTTSKWGASVDADMDLSEDVSIGRRGDERWECSLDDETKAWERNDRSLNSVHYHSNNRRSDDSSRCDSAKAMVIENSLGEQRQNPTCQEYRSHSVDKLAPHIQNHNVGLEAAHDYLSSHSANPRVFMNSGTHKYQGMVEHNRGPVLESGAPYELKDCRNSNGQSINLEIRSTLCDHSSVLDMKGQQMLSPISNPRKVNLDEPTNVAFPSNVNDQINRQQSTVQHMPEPTAYSYFPVQAPKDQFPPLNTSAISDSSVNNTHAVHVAKSFLDEIKTQLHTVLDASTLMATASSQSLLHPVLADCPQNISSPTRSLGQHPLINNDTVYGANDQKARELLSSLSAINPQLSILHQSGDPKVQVNGDSKENQHEVTKELEVNDNGAKFNMSKIEADNNCSNRADDQGKEEGGNNIKDEKVIRLFKNALVELVKDILKPKWKEGKMSREVHKTVVKKAVDKVTVTIKAENVPKTQEKVEQYLSSNRPRISKLVQAYAERSLKAGSEK